MLSAAVACRFPCTRGAQSICLSTQRKSQSSSTSGRARLKPFFNLRCMKTSCVSGKSVPWYQTGKLFSPSRLNQSWCTTERSEVTRRSGAQHTLFFTRGSEKPVHWSQVETTSFWVSPSVITPSTHSEELLALVADQRKTHFPLMIQAWLSHSSFICIHHYSAIQVCQCRIFWSGQSLSSLLSQFEVQCCTTDSWSHVRREAMRQHFRIP